MLGEPYHTPNHLLDLHCLHLGPREGAGFGVHLPLRLILPAPPYPGLSDQCAPFAAQLSGPEPISLPGESHSHPTQLLVDFHNVNAF